jgi:hypothetical protein
VLVQLAGAGGRSRLLALIAERATATLQRDPADFVPSGIERGRAEYLGPVATDARGVIQWIDPGQILPASVHDALLDAFGVASADGADSAKAGRSFLGARFDASADSAALAAVRVTPGDSMALARAAGADSGGRYCAHRNNSLLKYLVGRATYDCVELDVMLDTSARGDGPAFVYHPPTPDPGLPLYELLARTGGAPAGGMWLDVKNLDARNAPPFLARLAVLVPPALRGRVIVETDNRLLARSPAVRAIADSGFVLSYYIDTELGCVCSRATNAGCPQAIDSLVADLHGGAFTGLSFDARGRAVARALQDRLTPRPVLNTWTPMDRCADGTRAEPLDPPARDSLLGEVQKYLVHLRSPFNY